MKQILIAALTALFLAPASHAGVAVSQVDGELYFVEYQMGRMLQMAAPGVAGLMDSKKKADKKIGVKLHKVCLEEGFSYLYEATPADIMRDETLSGYFQMYAGGKLSEQREFGEHNMRANISKRFVYFTNEQRDGYRACVKQ